MEHFTNIVRSDVPFVPAGLDEGLMKAHPFKLNQVRLLEGPFKDAMQRTKRYLFDLESDRLLHKYGEQ